MIKKYALPGEGEGSTPTPFDCKYAPAERADTLPQFLLYPYIVCGTVHWQGRSAMIGINR
jgi:hypothetical protein